MSTNRSGNKHIHLITPSSVPASNGHEEILNKLLKARADRLETTVPNYRCLPQIETTWLWIDRRRLDLTCSHGRKTRAHRIRRCYTVKERETYLKLIPEGEGGVGDGFEIY